MSDESKPNAKPEAPVHLNIKVKDPQGAEIFFKVKKTTRFSKVIDAWCQRTGKNRDNVRFLFDGERITPEQTPDDLKMEDGDEIDAMVEQQGGC